MPVLTYILTALGAYLLGSIPTGYLVAKARGIDIRKTGSGNIGATNAMRVLGKPAGIFVLLMDAAKGYIACKILPPIIFDLVTPPSSGLAIFFQTEPDDIQTRFFVLAGICAVLGHNYTCWLKFKGGKGIATTAGVYLALVPISVGLGLAAFIVAVVITRYTSVGSLLAAIVLASTVIVTQSDLTLRIVTIALCVLAILKHRTNIQRLIAGTENKVQFGRRDPMKR